MALRRRKRPPQEIQFSFDSFLDLVANVVGIILRLILVAWVGGRGYKGLPVVPELPALPSIQLVSKAAEIEEEATKTQKEADSLNDRLARLQLQLAGILDKSGLLEKDAQWITQTETELERNLKDLNQEFEKESNPKGTEIPVLEANRSQMEADAKEIAKKIEELKKVPQIRKTHRWKTPVSQTLQTEELIFECRNGRVTGVDLAVMLDEIQGTLRQKGEMLRTQWIVEDQTRTYGSFRLKYAIEREKSALEQFGSGKPDDQTSFRYGLASWEVIPMDPNRGESLEDALKPGSRFRGIIDRLDSTQTAITFCVYPDSFAVYRGIRDFLHEKDIVVAGRPLPDDAPIAMNAKKGTASRGQ